MNKGRAPWWPFDERAVSYDRWYETPLGAFADRVERQAILGLLRPVTGERMLDVGCGTGRYARALAGRGVDVVGADPSGAMLTVAVSQYAFHGNPAYVRAVGERLPFAPAVFDAVTLVTTLEFVGDVDQAVQEAVRVVKPGGRLVVGVLNARGPWAARRRRSRDAVWRNARFFRRAEIEQQLRAFGEVRSRLALYVPPQLGRAPRSVFVFLERLGARFVPSLGAFVALRVDLGR